MSDARKSDILDVTATLHGETNRAILVSLDGERQSAVWLPLSQIEFERKERKGGVLYVEIQIPQWLAEQRGLA